MRAGLAPERRQGLVVLGGAAVTASFLGVTAAPFVLRAGLEPHQEALWLWVIGGLAAVCLAAEALEVARWVGPGPAEASVVPRPALSGEEVEVRVRQRAGIARLRGIEVRIVVVERRERLLQERLAIPVGRAAAARGARAVLVEGRVSLPPDAPATLAEPGRGVTWLLSVRRDLGWWPDVETRYVFEVRGPRAGSVRPEAP